MADSHTILLGNPAPQHQTRQDDGTVVGTPHPFLRQTVTRVTTWPGISDPETVAAATSTRNDRVLSLIHGSLPDEHKDYAIVLAELEQIVGVHTGGTAPTWVSTDDPVLQAAIARHFSCAEGQPIALLTNAGRDALHAQHIGSGAQPAAFQYLALTASVVAPAVTDTTLTGEIATASGGLIRAVATAAHSAGTNTSTLTKTFTSNGSDSLPVTIAQMGVFNAASAGTLGYHTALGSSATLSVVGDSVTLTWTDTAG